MHSTVDGYLIVAKRGGAPDAVMDRGLVGRTARPA